IRGNTRYEQARAALAHPPVSDAAPSQTVTAEELARLFHETYERLAPEHGYQTRPESAKPWEQVPEQNRRLMVAVCGIVLDALTSAPPQAAAAEGGDSRCDWWGHDGEQGQCYGRGTETVNGRPLCPEHAAIVRRVDGVRAHPPAPDAPTG